MKIIADYLFPQKIFILQLTRLQILAYLFELHELLHELLYNILPFVASFV